jgi:hypothetical protein
MTDYTDLIERLRGNDMPWSVKDAADALEAQAGRIAEIKAALDEILHYTGGANNALEDEYVMERARAAYLGEKE